METDTITIRPHQGPQEQFLSSCADIVIYGGAAGSGKTWGLLLEPLRHINNGDFSAVILRKTFPQIRNEGGLWDESDGLYPRLGAEPTLTRLEWSFPSGMSVRFAHLDHEKDVYNWQGAQIPLVGFDELTHFSERQFFYMLSRNRSVCGVAPYVRATCNPDADSWVAELIDWWIDDDTGLPIVDRSGAVRWFVRDGGMIRWGDSESEMLERYPELDAKSLTFIPALLEDNPTLCEADPGYKANLLALPTVDRLRLLNGNWKVASMEGAEWENHPEYFDHHIWCDEDSWPDSFELSAMALDGSKGKRADAGDYSALVFTGSINGLIYVDASIDRRSARTIIADTFSMYDEHQPMEVGVESNGFQDLFGDLFDSESQLRGRPPLPISLIHNSAPKPSRIMTLEPYLARRKFRIRRNAGGQLLVRQMRNFRQVQPVDHDDGPDGLEMSVRVLNHIASEALAV